MQLVFLWQLGGFSPARMWTINPGTLHLKPPQTPSMPPYLLLPHHKECSVFQSPGKKTLKRNSQLLVTEATGA